MKNVFNKKGVAYDTCMVIREDGSRRITHNQEEYFMSNPIRTKLDAYTLSGDGIKSYAFLDRRRNFISGERVTGDVIVDTSGEDIYFLVICGLVDNLDEIMVLDEGVESVTEYVGVS